MIYLIAACWKMQEKLLTSLLHMKKLIKQIVFNHLFATGRLFSKKSTTKIKLVVTNPNLYLIFIHLFLMKSLNKSIDMIMIHYIYYITLYIHYIIMIHSAIDDQESEAMHTRTASSYYNKENMWSKKEIKKQFDVSMDVFDGVKVCKLIGPQPQYNQQKYKH